MAWSGAAVLGPQIGLRVYGWNSTWLWLGCGSLGVFAAFALWRWGNSEDTGA